MENFDPIAERFFDAFSGKSSLSRREFIDEVRALFAMGADASLLSPLDKSQFEYELNEIRVFYASCEKPDFETEFRRAYLLQKIDDRLDIKEAEPRGRFSLPPADREVFSTYGILPCHRLASFSFARLQEVERSLDILAERNLNSSLGYLFDKNILELALSEEIVSRVSSLLGNDITFLGSSGPMYKAPFSRDATPWHNANAQTFGGGTEETNFDLVTCWIALSESSRAHGCMKMLPRSFIFNSLKLEMLKWDSDATMTGAGLVSFLKTHQYKFDLGLIAQMLCRRLMFKSVDGMFFTEGQNGVRRYNPFHSSVDMTVAVGIENLELIAPVDGIVMEAKRGDMYMFISQNTHGSFQNTTGDWRKAIALRYVKTGLANPNVADDSFRLLNLYLANFPGAERVLSLMKRPLENFRQASPRLLIRGLQPSKQESIYFDTAELRSVLESESPLRNT